MPADLQFIHQIGLAVMYYERRYPTTTPLPHTPKQLHPDECTNSFHRNCVHLSLLTHPTPPPPRSFITLPAGPSTNVPLMSCPHPTTTPHPVSVGTKGLHQFFCVYSFTAKEPPCWSFHRKHTKRPCTGLYFFNLTFLKIKSVFQTRDLMCFMC